MMPKKLGGFGSLDVIFVDIHNDTDSVIWVKNLRVQRECRDSLCLL